MFVFFFYIFFTRAKKLSGFVQFAFCTFPFLGRQSLASCELLNPRQLLLLLEAQISLSPSAWSNLLAHDGENAWEDVG